MANKSLERLNEIQSKQPLSSEYAFCKGCQVSVIINSKSMIKLKPIKFRAWDAKNKRIINVSSLAFAKTGVDIATIDFGMEDWINGELMQFTGLLDKNGKEIYEGDIVKVKWGGVGDVVFKDGGFVSQWENGNVEYRVCKSDIESREVEVIGNIYENPELLGKEGE